MATLDVLGEDVTRDDLLAAYDAVRLKLMPYFQPTTSAAASRASSPTHRPTPRSASSCWSPPSGSSQRTDPRLRATAPRREPVGGGSGRDPAHEVADAIDRGDVDGPTIVAIGTAIRRRMKMRGMKVSHRAVSEA